MIQIENLTCKLGDFNLDVDINIEGGEYFVVLGPNGAGKTVLLETIAGFNNVNNGSIRFDGREIQQLPPEKRGISIVYQDNALFPHLSVRDNIIYGLKARKSSSEEIKNIIERVTEITGITDLLSREPITLSGGEKRKVALARALSIKPDVLLLDEPLNALDPETREKMIIELMNIHTLLNLTTIHVCHDFTEAFSLGRRIAVMQEGSICQVGTPEQIFHQPNSEFVARFTMARNIFTGKVTFNDRNIFVFRTQDIKFIAEAGNQNANGAAIRPEDISVSAIPVPGKHINCLEGKVTRIVDKGSVLDVTVSTPVDFICQLNRRNIEEIKLEQNMKVYIVFAPASVSLF
jgi:ABC-type Fe3+/spermidine/putrescine transport system ATPase subunit